jgi:hypothetical protein
VRKSRDLSDVDGTLWIYKRKIENQDKCKWKMGNIRDIQKIVYLPTLDMTGCWSSSRFGATASSQSSERKKQMINGCSYHSEPCGGQGEERGVVTFLMATSHLLSVPAVNITTAD